MKKLFVVFSVFSLVLLASCGPKDNTPKAPSSNTGNSIDDSKRASGNVELNNNIDDEKSLTGGEDKDSSDEKVTLEEIKKEYKKVTGKEASGDMSLEDMIEEINKSGTENKDEEKTNAEVNTGGTEAKDEEKINAEVNTGGTEAKDEEK